MQLVKNLEKLEIKICKLKEQNFTLLGRLESIDLLSCENNDEVIKTLEFDMINVKNNHEASLLEKHLEIDTLKDKLHKNENRVNIRSIIDVLDKL